MDRAESVKAGAQAAATAWREGHIFGLDGTAPHEAVMKGIATAVIDAVEPLIRADERESVKAEYIPVLMEHLRILADLRAKVEALHRVAVGREYRYAIEDVLALFGDNDD